jgi:hypothetical protein
VIVFILIPPFGNFVFTALLLYSIANHIHAIPLQFSSLPSQSIANQSIAMHNGSMHFLRFASLCFSWLLCGSLGFSLAARCAVPLHIASLLCYAMPLLCPSLHNISIAARSFSPLSHAIPLQLRF